mmetsp:Transcript_59187/g.173121  ORF Transcript_59187/g.173121 Transcript_59187/m.173121 type:complete len:226 (+) Transcript_59187:104-781(+)
MTTNQTAYRAVTSAMDSARVYIRTPRDAKTLNKSSHASVSRAAETPGSQHNSRARREESHQPRARMKKQPYVKNLRHTRHQSQNSQKLSESFSMGVADHLAMLVASRAPPPLSASAASWYSAALLAKRLMGRIRSTPPTRKTTVHHRSKALTYAKAAQRSAGLGRRPTKVRRPSRTQQPLRTRSEAPLPEPWPPGRTPVQACFGCGWVPSSLVSASAPPCDIALP